MNTKRLKIIILLQKETKKNSWTEKKREDKILWMDINHAKCGIESKYVCEIRNTCMLTLGSRGQQSWNSLYTCSWDHR